jgi:ribosomal protein S18 acetylase RimI-like enzyme
MTIRAIEARDLAELFDLRASTRENPYSRDALREIGITEETTAARLRTTNRGWLCETEGKLVGFAIGDGSTGEMCVIAVLPEFEGQRVGSRLLDAVEAWLYSLGWKELWLWTSADTKRRAFTFYTGHGWTISENKGEIVYMKKKAPNQPPDPAPALVMPPAGQEPRPRLGADH